MVLQPIAGLGPSAAMVSCRANTSASVRRRPPSNSRMPARSWKNTSQSSGELSLVTGVCRVFWKSSWGGTDKTDRTWGRFLRNAPTGSDETDKTSRMGFCRFCRRPFGGFPKFHEPAKQRATVPSQCSTFSAGCQEYDTDGRPPASRRPARAGSDWSPQERPGQHQRCLRSLSPAQLLCWISRAVKGSGSCARRSRMSRAPSSAIVSPAL